MLVSSILPAGALVEQQVDEARTIDGIQQLASGAMWGDKTSAQSLEAAFRLVHSHLPGQNLFYAKALLDFAIFDRVYNSINPGSVDEREARRHKERETSKVFGD